MAQQTWEVLLNAYEYSGTKSGAALKESTALTDISPGANTAGQALLIPAGTLKVGNILRYTACGTYSTTGTPTLKLGLYWGGVAGITLAETIAVETKSSVTHQSWRLEAISRVVEIGSSGAILTQGTVVGVESVSAITTNAGTTMLPEEATGGNEVTINTDESKIITVSGKWSASSASNAINCYQWLVELLN